MLSSLNPKFQDQKYDLEDANLYASNRFPTAFPSFFEGVRQFARPLPWASGLLQASGNCQSQSQLRLQVHRQVAQRNLVKLRNKVRLIRLQFQALQRGLGPFTAVHSFLSFTSLLFLFFGSLAQKNNTTSGRWTGCRLLQQNGCKYRWT